ncbi:hypothetical protein [Microbulbifer marinus]|uniref:Uncharacterized protein n=1 Tax=Microbulbifer marinus TaxID=658218 RepID=A0A1H3VUZ6_9GAMM|nr:hypothetical protein [Microbulbifer marinus]SDZ78665.1 hypothetical protein SAMN05216562_0299 [Microbulbifer marinus]
MGNKDSVRFVVLDPALIKEGGHHTALSLLVAASKEDDVDVTFISHQYISDSLKQQLENNGCIVKPEFLLNFYEIFEKQIELNAANAYVLNAAKEYAKVIQGQCEQGGSGKLVFFHPSMSWEHAYALSLALKTIDYSMDMCHIVCAMFNPGLGPDGTVFDPQRKLNFEIAFRAVSSSTRVKLFASDIELSSIYKKLLNLGSDVPVHPCYLSTWMRSAKEESGDPNCDFIDDGSEIILYMGDAKSEKGFCDLPDLVCESLKNVDSHQKLYIQFNIPWPDPELEMVAEKLRYCASVNEQLILHEGFISQHEVERRLSNASLFVFNYCNEHYQNKSSGFLWFVVWHQTPVYFFGHSWLSREARRLSAPVLGQSRDRKQFWAAIRESRKYRIFGAPSSRFYFDSLYRDFWDWIKEVCQSA